MAHVCHISAPARVTVRRVAADGLHWGMTTHATFGQQHASLQLDSGLYDAYPLMVLYLMFCIPIMV